MQDELLLPGLSRRAAVVDIVVMLLFIFVMGRAVVAWGDAYQESHPMSKDVVSSWLLPVVVGSLFALALAATQTRLGKLTAAALGLRRGDLAVQVLWGVAGAALGLLADALWGAIQLALTVALHRAHLPKPHFIFPSRVVTI